MSAVQDLINSANNLVAADQTEAAEVADLQARIAAAEAELASAPGTGDATVAAVVAALPADALVAQLESLGYSVTPPAA